ncbi:hypothetical protein BYT27DRAFT_7222928 [Phlegmacium glaucopus]|nr:hypothetical protein BYT27DRAFT_7222928 [Phlegmacium glaucopus]
MLWFSCTAHQSKLNGKAGPWLKEHCQEAIEYLSLGDLWDDFPRANINQLLSPDLLHQVIKGGFKDHLITWVGEYLNIEHGTSKAKEIMDDIDRRIALAPSFPGLHWFPQGQNFKQWTGNDSKALMKVYVTAIEGHVPQDMVCAPVAYLDFCYLVRRAQLTECTLEEVDEALSQFHHYRAIFPGPSGLSLPCQHSLVHYHDLIEAFGSPNGLCSLITEAKHIKAVKEPWWHSSHYDALGQMLVTNQQLDKLAAAHVNFTDRGMLNGSCLQDAMAIYLASIEEESEGSMDDEEPETLPEDEDVDSGPVDSGAVNEHGYPKVLCQIGIDMDIPSLHFFTHQFLTSQVDPEADPVSTFINPIISGPVRVFHSALIVFHAPSDPSGMTGMRRKYARSTPSWRQDGPRQDCVFVTVNPDAKGIRQLEVAQVLLFFSFVHERRTYPCALVHWFPRIDEAPDADMGMWIVQPEFTSPGKPALQVIISTVATLIHIDTIARLAHLLPIFGQSFVPISLHFSQTLDSFHSYYISKYADHNAFDITTASQ